VGNRYHELKISTARVKVGVGIAQLLLPLLIPLGSLGAVFDGDPQPRADSFTGATGEVLLQKAAFLGIVHGALSCLRLLLYEQPERLSGRPLPGSRHPWRGESTPRS
jgi:hypothetical protein